MQKSLLLLSLFFSWFIVQAQQKENEDASIVIQSAKIKIHSTVYIATTVVELELYNPNGKIMDGTVEFSLNEGQVINKFKLDVDGSMRDGVVIEKQQARVAYENIIRRRVDPGLLEQTAPNQYRIRVYPMPAKGKRYVSFGVQELLMQKKQQADYLFPLSFVNTVKQIEVDITVASAQNPFTSSGLLQGKTFGNVPNKQLNFNSNSISNKDFLLFSIPLSNAASVCQYTNDECDQPFFGRVTPNDLPMSKSAISQVTVFWDVSSSGERRDIEKEIGFLEAYLKKYHPTAVHLVTFAIDIVEERRFDLPTKNLASIKRFLRQQKMDGGTRLNKIYCKKYPADEYLLFSDGQTTFGNGGLHTADQPVFAIYSTAPANVALLDEIAGSTGGKTINLVLLDIQDAILSLDKPQWNPLVSKEKLNQFELQIVGDGESFLIKGINKSNADSLVIDFFYAGQIQKVSIPLRFGNCVEEGLSEAALLLNWQLARKNKLAPDSLHSIATDLNAVSPSTSLIVLETLEDYYQFKITPPKDLLNEFKKRYPSLPDKKGISQSDKDILVYNKLTQSVNEYNKKIAWWDPHMTAISLKPYTEKNFSPAATANIENKESDDNGMDRIGTKSSELSQVVVVGYGTQRRRAATGSVSKISTSELTSNGTVQSALQGRVSGLSITGDYNSVHVRGTTSIRGANEPMYILDGVPIDATTAMTMPTSNIASITIVKDATASAIYGSRAANGVIIIETKRAPLSYSAPVKEDAKQEIIDSFEALSNSVTYDRYI
jgi:TonB-dependent SusC/RagA subfamily outer membrane receptor